MPEFGYEDYLKTGQLPEKEKPPEPAAPPAGAPQAQAPPPASVKKGPSDYERFLHEGVPGIPAAEFDASQLTPEMQKTFKAAPKTVEEQGTGVLGSVARGALQGVGSIAKLGELAGEAMEAGGMGAEGKLLKQIGSGVSGGIEEFNRQYLPRPPAAARMPKIEAADILSDPVKVAGQVYDYVTHPQFWTTQVPEGLGSMIPMLAGSALSLLRYGSTIATLQKAGKAAEAAALAEKASKVGKVLGFLTAGGMEGGSAYEALQTFEKETGQQVPLHLKVITTLGTGAVNGLLEMVGLEKVGAGQALRRALLSKEATETFEKAVTPGLLKAIRRSVAGEGTTEGAQELVANAFAKYGYNPNKELLEGVVESALAGGVAGGIVGGPLERFQKHEPGKETGAAAETRPPAEQTPAGVPATEAAPEQIQPTPPPETPPQAGPAPALTPTPPGIPPLAPEPVGPEGTGPIPEGAPETAPEGGPPAAVPGVPARIQPTLPVPANELEKAFEGSPLADLMRERMPRDQAVTELLSYLDSLEDAERFHDLWVSGDLDGLRAEFPDHLALPPPEEGPAAGPENPPALPGGPAPLGSNASLGKELAKPAAPQEEGGPAIGPEKPITPPEEEGPALAGMPIGPGPAPQPGPAAAGLPMPLSSSATQTSQLAKPAEIPAPAPETEAEPMPGAPLNPDELRAALAKPEEERDAYDRFVINRAKVEGVTLPEEEAPEEKPLSPQEEFLKKFGTAKRGEKVWEMKTPPKEGAQGEDKGGIENPEMGTEFTTPDGSPVRLVRADQMPMPPGIASFWVVPTRSVATEPEVFQYKLGYEEGTGAGLALQDVTKWDPDLAGVLVIYRYPDGRLAVVDGHQRLALANRLSQAWVPAHIWDASEMTVQDARARAALRNITAGRGTNIDAAKFFRDSGYSPETLKEMGVSLKERIVRDGLALAKLNGELFTAVTIGKFPVEWAIPIGENLGDNEDAQNKIAKVLMDLDREGKNPSKAEVDRIIRLATAAGTQMGTQGGLFGEEEFAHSLLYEMSKILNALRARMVSVKNVMVRAVKGQDIIEALGGKVEAETTEKAAKEKRADIFIFDKSAEDSQSAVNQLAKHWAAQLAKFPEKQKEIIDHAWEEIEEALNRDYERLMGRPKEGREVPGKGQSETGPTLYEGPSEYGRGRGGPRTEEGIVEPKPEFQLRPPEALKKRETRPGHQPEAEIDTRTGKLFDEDKAETWTDEQRERWNTLKRVFPDLDDGQVRAIIFDNELYDRVWQAHATAMQQAYQAELEARRQKGAQGEGLFGTGGFGLFAQAEGRETRQEAPKKPAVPAAPPFKLKSPSPQESQVERRVKQVLEEFPNLDRAVVTQVVRMFPDAGMDAVHNMVKDPGLFKEATVRALKYLQKPKPPAGTPAPKGQTRLFEPGHEFNAWFEESARSRQLPLFTPEMAESERRTAFTPDFKLEKAVDELVLALELPGEKPGYTTKESVKKYLDLVRREFGEQSVFNLEGRKFDPVMAPYELATMAQVMRSPAFEVLQVIYTKGDAVVGHHAITCGDLSSCSIGRFQDFVADVQAKAKKYGADKAHIIHNHPSSNPEMSSADKRLAQTLRYGFLETGQEGREPMERSGLGDLMGQFIVIDHDRFSWLEPDPYGDWRMMTGAYKPRNVMGDWLTGRLRVESVPKLAELAGRLPAAPDRESVFVYTDANNRVNGVIVCANEVWNAEPEDLKHKLQTHMRLHNATRVSIITKFDNGNFVRFIQHEIDLTAAGRSYLGGWIQDIQSFQGSSLRADEAYEAMWREPANYPRTVRPPFDLMEAEPPYETGEPDTPRGRVEQWKSDRFAPTEGPKNAWDRFNEWKNEAGGVIPALKKVKDRLYFEMFSETAPQERLAAEAMEKTIPGLPRQVGHLLNWSLAAHRGHLGTANSALTGDGVYLPQVQSGFDTKETQALEQEIQDLVAESEGRMTYKIRRKMEKLAEKHAEKFTTGELERVYDSLAAVLQPIREMADRRGLDVDQVFDDLFKGLMGAERNLELAGVIGQRAKTIDKGVDPDAAHQVLDDLKEIYGQEDYAAMGQVADRVREWARWTIVEPLVRAGRLSREKANEMKAGNLYYVPYFRLMDEMEKKGFVSNNENLFEVRRIPIKEIRGSERKIVDPLEMFISLAYNVADTASRAQVAQTVVQVPLFTEAGDGIKVVPAKYFPVDVELKQEIDPALRSGLQKIADALGVDVQVKQRLKGMRNKLGAFRREVAQEVRDGEITENERQWIELMFGTTERVKAHEIGHALDAKYDLQSLLMSSPQLKRELRAIADQRVSEFSSKAFRRYVRQRGEQVADFVNRYVNAYEQARITAPAAVRVFEHFLNRHEELKPLLTLRPTAQVDVMTMTGQTWAKSPFKPEKNAMLIYRQGKPYWVVMPEDLYKAMTLMTHKDLGLIVQWAAKPAQWLRMGAVLSPEFITRNPIRDVVMAWLFNRYGFSFKEWFGDFHRLLTKDPEAMERHKEFLAGGGPFADLGTMMMQLPKITAEDIKGKGKLWIKYVAHPLQALNEISSFVENVTRYSVYRQARANGASHAQAIHEARTVTIDFHRFGANKYIRALNATIPFFNATLQGMDKIGTELLSPDTPNARKMEILKRIAVGIVFPSIALWFGFHDDDRVKELEAWERNLFWHIPIPGGPVLRIPKPFEVGIFFGSIPERILDYYKTHDARGFKQALRQLGDAFLPNFIPTVARPFIEQGANWNFFLDRPIEDQALKNLPTELRSKPWTSEAAKFFSRNFGKHAGISPVQLEAHIRSLFGGLGGNYMLPAMDYAMRKTGMAADIPKADEKLLHQIPFVRALFSREPTGFRAKSANDFFDNYNQAIVGDQGWKHLWKKGRMEEAADFIREHPEALFGKMVRKQMDELGKLRKDRDIILESKNLDAAAKREKVDRLDAAIAELTRMNAAIMSPKVMSQVAMPAADALKKAPLKKGKEAETYYKYADDPPAEAYKKVRKQWKSLAQMDDDEREEAIARIIRQEQRTYRPKTGGGDRGRGLGIPGLPLPGETGTRSIDFLGLPKEKSGKGLAVPGLTPPKERGYR